MVRGEIVSICRFIRWEYLSTKWRTMKGYPRADRVREELSAGTRGDGSTNRYGTFPLRPSASGPGEWPRSPAHPLAESACCPAVQIRAPAEPAAAWLAARGEYLRLRPRTGSLCPLARSVRAFA